MKKNRRRSKSAHALLASAGLAGVPLVSAANDVPMPPDPRPKEATHFDHPFVEKVKILREWDGETAEDQFGWIARNIGDVDKDGVPDVVTSAPTHGKDGHTGRVYVYSTRSGNLLWQADGSPGDEFGSGVEGAGDTNGDGVPDVVASGPLGGVAFIYSGSDGKVLQRFKSVDPDEQFGLHVSGIGDIDGDGAADIIVGAPGKDGEDKTAGHAYVYSGKTGALLATFAGERKGDQFGSAVAGGVAGNHRYLLIGAPLAGGEHRGRVYVYDGLSKAPAFTIESDETGKALGKMFLSVVGDVDADGIPDLYASDWSNSAKGRSTGRIYVHSGRTGARLLTLTGETAGEGFGIGPADAGDVDGDGHADLIIGSWQFGKEAVSGGRAVLFSGKDSHILATYTCRIPGDTFGFDATNLGDIDGDGTVDFLITSGWSGVHGHHSGRVFIISSGIRAKK
jgi:hypothetical protein